MKISVHVLARIDDNNATRRHQKRHQLPVVAPQQLNKHNTHVMPPVRTSHGKKNTAFKPPRKISDNSNSSEPGPSKPTTVPRSIPAASSTSKAAAASTRPASAFKPATTLISSDTELDDIDDDDDDDDDDDADIVGSAHRRRSANDASTTELTAAVPAADSQDDADDEAPPIPVKLLNRLLHDGFADEDMRIGKEAMAVAGKYVETFVREALARSVFEREEAEREGGGADDGFLQVEDLEKLAPQLLLDF